MPDKERTWLELALYEDGRNPMEADFPFGGNKGINCADPTADQDVATKKYHDDNLPAYLHQALSLYAYSDSLGTWIQGVADYGAYFIYNTSPSDGQYVEYTISLAAGNYRVLYAITKTAVYGILDIDIDGVEVHSVDLYAAVSAVSIDKFSFVVTSGGVHTIKFRCDGKNASSSGYGISFMMPVIGRYS